MENSNAGVMIPRRLIARQNQKSSPDGQLQAMSEVQIQIDL
jgi:hypothetical protein